MWVQKKKIIRHYKRIKIILPPIKIKSHSQIIKWKVKNHFQFRS